MFNVKRPPVGRGPSDRLCRLNANDALVGRWPPLCAGSVIFFAQDGSHRRCWRIVRKAARHFVRDGQ